MRKRKQLAYEFTQFNADFPFNIKANLLIPVAIRHVLFSWMSCACLSVSQPSDGASCQSAADTGVTMAAVVKSVAPRSIAGAQGEILFSQLSAGDRFWCFLYIMCYHDDPLTHLLITGGSKGKFKKNLTQGGWYSDQFRPSRNKSLSTETPWQYLPGACYLSSPIRSKFRMPVMFHQ